MTNSDGRPQPTADNFHRKEFPAKYPQRFDEDNEISTKQGRYLMRRQTNRENLVGDNSRWMMREEEEEEGHYVRHSFDGVHHPQNELFDPDFGWQKMSAV